MRKEEKMLTILIPTRNRPKFLGRLLGYYASVGCPYQIFIGDSSDANFQTEIKQLEQRYCSHGRILFNYYPHDSTLGPGEEITKFMAKLLEQVETPYAVFNPDDDLFVPKALEKCIHFLENNPDYSLAYGVGVLMDIENGEPYGRITGTHEYPQKSNEFPKAQDRFPFYMGGGGTNAQFSVKRTPQCREGWQLAYQLGLDNYFEEYLSNALSAIQGKFKKIEELYLIRQTHPAMKSKVKDILDWLVHPSFSKNYYDFLQILTGELVKRDNLGEWDAKEIIRKAFWFVLANTSKRKWEQKYIQRSFKSQIFKSQIKKHIGAPRINSIRKFTYSFFPSGKLTLPALLRTSSPFYEDFLPIYRAISNKGEKSL